MTDSATLLRGAVHKFAFAPLPAWVGTFGVRVGGSRSACAFVCAWVVARVRQAAAGRSSLPLRELLYGPAFCSRPSRLPRTRTGTRTRPPNATRAWRERCLRASALSSLSERLCQARTLRASGSDFGAA